MPLPKDSHKIIAYKKKMSIIAKSRGYGKWMTGKKLSAETIKKLQKIQKEIGNTPEEKVRRSQRAKQLGTGKWMSGRKDTPFLLSSKKVHRFRKGKTYEEIYGKEAKNEILKRKLGNRKRFIGKILKNDIRPKHNGDYKYIEWRVAIFKRDNYICQVCFVKGGFLEAHHIKMWSRYPRLRYEIENGLTVHKGNCHQIKNRESRLIFLGE